MESPRTRPPETGAAGGPPGPHRPAPPPPRTAPVGPTPRRTVAAGPTPRAALAILAVFVVLLLPAARGEAAAGPPAGPPADVHTDALRDTVPESPTSGSHHVVLVPEDGPPRRLAPGSLPAAEDLEGVRHAWVWAAGVPPRRVAAEEWRADPATVLERVLAPAAAPAPRLRATVAAPGDRRLPRRVIAAPQAMWEEVPEELLPAYPLPEDDDAVSLPVDPAVPYRVRALTPGATPGAGSWWADLPAGTRTVALAPVPAPDLVLEVAGDAAGPVAGSRISILADEVQRGERHKLADLRTGEDGRALLPALPDGAPVVLLVAAPEHAPTAFRGLPSQLPARLRVEPGTTVRGRFVSEEGLPLAGVRLRAVGWVAPDLPIPVSLWEVTGPDGTWELPPLPRHRFELTAHAAERAPWSRLLDLAPPPGDPTPAPVTLELGTVELPPSHPIRVTVVDDLGRPVPGADLAVDGRLSGTFTDAAGQAWIDVVPDRPFRVEVRAPRHRTATFDRVPPLPETLRLELVRAVVVTGTFLDADGLPVPDGNVLVRRGNEIRATELGDGGRIDLELEPGEAHQLELRSPRTARLEIPLEPGVPGEVRDLGPVTAPPGLAVTGRLLRADTGEPVAGATVWLPRPSEGGPLVGWVLNDLLETRSDDRGSFELRGLSPLPATLRVDAPGLARRQVPLLPEPGSRLLDLGDLELHGGTRLAVHLVPAEGGELPGDGEATATVDLGHHGLGRDQVRAPVVDGTAHLPPLPAGTVTAAVYRGRDLLCEATATLEPDQAEAEVECHDRDVPVQGRVEVGDHPDGPGVLSWMAATEEDEGASMILNLGAGSGVQQQQVFTRRRPDVTVEVGEDGSFSSPGLRPGRWEVLWLPHSGASRGPVQVEIPVPASGGAAGTFRTVLRFPALAVSGVVVDDRGEPVEGARVRAAGGARTVLSGADGSFVLAGLEPGTHHLQARADGRASPPRAVTLEADRQPDPVELVLGAEESRLTVTVLTAEDLPAPGALVFLEVEGRPLRILTVDRDGHARVPVPSPPPARLRAAAHLDGTWALGEWLPLEQALDEGLHLQGGDTGVLAMRSEEAAGRPALTAPGGWDLAALLLWLGSPPHLAPASPLVLPGLPPGPYRVGLGEREERVDLRPGETAEVEL